MAKVSKEVKEARINEEKEITAKFKEMPLSEYVGYIKKNVPSADKEKYKKCARRAITIEDIINYLNDKGISDDDKKGFINKCISYEYVKDGNKYKLDENGNKIKKLDDNGDPIPVKSALSIIQHFITEYMPELKAKAKPKSNNKPLNDFWDGKW